MPNLYDSLIQGVVSVLAILITILFTGLRGYLQTKVSALKAKTEAKNFELAKNITGTVVEAVEQIFRHVADAGGKEKFEAAERLVIAELEKAGITLDAESRKALIEAAVNGMNSLKNIEG